MAHSAFQLYAHITWHTWSRVGCVDETAAADVHRAINVAGRRTAISVIAAAVLADHVHVLVSFKPTSVLSEFVRVAKSGSAVEANRRTGGTVRWARGFYVASLHKTDLPRVARYVRRQFERHPELIPRKTRSTL